MKPQGAHIWRFHGPYATSGRCLDQSVVITVLVMQMDVGVCEMLVHVNARGVDNLTLST